MKLLFACLLMLASASAFPQFNGKLIYQLDQSGYRTVMTYIQGGTNAIVEAYTIKLNSGVPDTTTLHPQDTILFDFAAATETHLQHATMNAYKQKYMGNMMAAAMAAKGNALGGSVAVSAVGSVTTVNGYNCNEYEIVSSSKLGTSTKDVWTTGDIGGSPTLWVVGAFTYYTPGYPHFTKLTAAGATGVVVKVNSSYTHQGLQYSMNLVSVDTNFKPRSRGYFDVPSRYNLIDQTGFTLQGN